MKKKKRLMDYQAPAHCAAFSILLSLRTSSGPRIALSTLFSDTLTLCSSLVSHPIRWDVPTERHLFWDVIIDVSEEHITSVFRVKVSSAHVACLLLASHVFNLEEGGSILLRNIDVLTWGYTAPCPRILYFLYFCVL